ncbi:MAG TPA: 4a-hydroxytetrahydrobiopterin dehydratase [Trebonia sp.]|nr:4a-hydroxytetrahydrobiopterin dehydratase [Trebonia sp.]
MALRDEIITAADLPERLAALPGWQGDTTGISKDYPIGWDSAVQMAAAAGPLAVELEHRPDMDIRWTGLRVFLTTHTAGDVVTELDLVTAARLDTLAASFA